MPVTQVEIAKIVGLDTSSVNKILNKVEGPSFRPETIETVFSVAKSMGYNFRRATKATLRVAMERLFPVDVSNVVLSVNRTVSVDEVVQIKKMLYQGYKISKEGR